MITELKGKIKKKIVKILRKHYPWLWQWYSRILQGTNIQILQEKGKIG